MDRRNLHIQIREILRLYDDEPITATNKILDLFSAVNEGCKHKDVTRLSDEYVCCHQCDQYFYYPKQN